MDDEKYRKLILLSKRDERTYLLGIIELLRDELGDSTYEQYAKKVLNRVIYTIELLRDDINTH